MKQQLNQYTKKLRIFIGNLNININSDIEFKIAQNYIPFMIENINNKSIVNIDIKNDNKPVQYFNKCKLILNGSTNAWFNLDNKYYLFVFGQRYKVVSDFFNDENLWYAICRKDFSYCNLIIPDGYNYSNEEFTKELYERPWLQRIACAKLGLGENYIFHGACIKINSTGLLALGNSGVGKSTLCKLFENKNYEIVADDRILISLKKDKLIVQGTPWNNKNPQYSINKKINAQYILFLNHGDENKIVNISKKATIKKLINQLYYPYPINNNDILKWAMISSFNIYNNFSIGDLFFKPDNTVITYILKLIKTNFYT